MRAVVALTVFAVLASDAALAGQIEAACLKSSRAKGQYGLCGCIQDAADRTLTQKDQKLASTFFADPHRAQEVRQSKSRRLETFWDRYENFGQTARTFCGK